MTRHPFSLVPFPGSPAPGIRIEGEVAREGCLLVFSYSLTGDTNDILLPEKSVQPARQEELWLATCFELFLAVPGLPGYWEVNLSPSGDWNVYRMDAYRRAGFREERSIPRLEFEAGEDGGRLVLRGEVDLSPILGPDEPLHAGVTCVIQARGGAESYWALAHPGAQPDFHLREGFLIRL